MTRNGLRDTEENIVLGTVALTDAEVAALIATADCLRSIIPVAFGTEWNDLVFSGDGYVVTEVPRSSGERYFDGYRGVRKTPKGCVAISASERNSESGAVTFIRFEDAVKGYVANIVSSFRGRGPGSLGSVAWVWNGATGQGVFTESLNPLSGKDFRYCLRDDPRRGSKETKSRQRSHAAWECRSPVHCRHHRAPRCFGKGRDGVAETGTTLSSAPPDVAPVQLIETAADAQSARRDWIGWKRVGR